MSHTQENVRLDTLCDGVFAIAMTLLVLEIKVPNVASVHSTAELWRVLGASWPSLFAFCLSFMIIFVLWFAHTGGSRLIDRVSPQFVFATGSMLLVVAFLPFPTALMAEYLATDFAQPAIIVYSFACLLNNITWMLVSASVTWPVSLLKNPDDLEVMASGRRMGGAGVVFSTAVFLLAFRAPYVALAANAFFWVFAVFATIAFQRPEAEVG